MSNLRLAFAAGILTASCSHDVPDTSPPLTILETVAITTDPADPRGRIAAAAPRGVDLFEWLTLDEFERHPALVFVCIDGAPNGVPLDRGEAYVEVETNRGTVKVETRAGQSIGDVAAALERELVDLGHDVRVVEGAMVVVLLDAESQAHIGNDVTDDGLELETGFALRP